MKYFRIFSHTSAYTEYMASEDAVIPNIAYCLNDNRTYISTEKGGDMYQWVQIPLSEDYDCDMVEHVKYYVEKQQVSHDGGTTWEDTGSERRGASAETQSTDCGYVEPQYQWVNLDPTVDYYCNQETHIKYYKQQRQVSYDGGTTWENVVPAEYQQGGVAGLILTSNEDSSKKLFFPAAGRCGDGSVDYVGKHSVCWSRSLYGYGVNSAYGMSFSSGSVGWGSDLYRYYGYHVRGVLG